MTTDTTELEHDLKSLAEPSKRDWWTNYVKGAEFYGVAMAGVRRVGIHWWDSKQHDDPVSDALALCSHPITEVRLAGVAIMEHVLMPAALLSAVDLPRIRATLDDGALDDWNTCDWFSVKILNRLMKEGDRADHVALLGWHDSRTLWTRRSALVGFVNLLAHTEPSSGFDDQFLATAGELANDDRRFCQTAIGWTMRELSARRPSAVEVFVEDHLARLSRELITNAVRRLEPDIRTRLLDKHKAV